MTIKREVWTLRGKRRRVNVSRVNGKLKGWSLVTGDKRKIADIRRQYKQSHSLHANVKEFVKYKNGNALTTSTTRETGTQKRTQIFAHLSITKLNKQGKPIGRPRTFWGVSRLGMKDEAGKTLARKNAINSAIASGFVYYDNYRVLAEQYEYQNWKTRGNLYQLAHPKAKATA